MALSTKEYVVMGKARVIHFVLGNVQTDARVRKSGRALRDLGYEVIYVGELRDPVLQQKRFFRSEDIDDCPHYQINDGRRIYDTAITHLNQLNPLHIPHQKIKTSIWRALRENGAKPLDRIQALSLVPAYATCLATRGIRPGDIWDRLHGFQTRAARIASELMNLKPDLIHAHDLDAFALIAPFCKANGVKLIYDSHELERGRNAPRWTEQQRAEHTALEQNSIGRADAVITVSQSIGEILKKTYSIPAPIIVPNSPPRANVRENTPLRVRLGLTDDHKVLLYLGGIMPGRGLETLFEILPDLPDTVHLAFIGYPVRIFEQGFEDMLSRAGSIRHRIHLLGRKPYEDVIYEAYGADLGYNAIELTCESYENALPNKFFEYVFANIPVISTPQADVVNLTRDFRLGEIVPDRDRAALTSTIKKMLFEAPHKIEAEKRVRFMDEYCWEKQSHKLERLYSDLL